MKCEKCHKKLIKVAYYKTQVVCPRCFERTKWKDKSCSIEEFRELAIQRGRRATEMCEKRKKEKDRIDNLQS